MNAPLISVIVPVYNEEANVEKAYSAIKAVFEKLEGKYRFEIIFTDNCSQDNTLNILKDLARNDSRIKVAGFVRNFGFNKSLLTGYRLASGDAAIQIDCDLQDPPSLFVDFLAKWREGYDVVVGIRKTRPEGAALQFMRKLFYRFLGLISEDNLVVDGGDFRLVDKKILAQLKTIHDGTPYVRGLISNLAANQTGIVYERTVRLHGQSKFPLIKLFSLAIDGIVSHSTVPLRLASFVGLTISILTASLAGVYLFGKLFMGYDWPDGFATSVVLILFGISLNAIFLGIIGEYITRIYHQLKQQPITVIQTLINFEQSKD